MCAGGDLRVCVGGNPGVCAGGDLSPLEQCPYTLTMLPAVPIPAVKELGVEAKCVFKKTSRMHVPDPDSCSFTDSVVYEWLLQYK